MNNVLTRSVCKFENLLARVPDWLLALLIRLAAASVFWRSAQTKITGWELFGQHWHFFNLSDTTFILFEYEYALPLLPYRLAAYMATFGEFFLSLAIAVGFLTRFSALGLMIMTLVIQVFVYPDAWNVHVLWAGLLLYLIKNGGGRVSLDRLLVRRCN